MTNKEAINVLSEIYMHVTVDSLEATIMVERHNKALDMAISALESQDGDTISRQAAVDALEKVADLFPWRVPGKRDTYDSYNEAWNDAIGRAEMEIENLPSAQPEQIRCKDCLIHGICRFEQGLGLDGYCSQAERREE